MWLHSMLNGHPLICMVEELLQPDDASYLLNLGLGDASFDSGASGRWAAWWVQQRLRALENRNDWSSSNITVLLQMVDFRHPHPAMPQRAGGCRPNASRAIGFKLMEGRDTPVRIPIMQLDRAFPKARPSSSGMHRLVAWLRLHRARLILLEREGLALYISELALQRKEVLNGSINGHIGVAHCVSDTCARLISDRIRLTIDPLEALKALDTRQRRWDVYLSWARKALPSDQLLHVQYDDLRAEPLAEMNRIFRFLGVPPRDLTWHAPYHMVKTQRHKLDEVITNANEVRATFAGTRWERELMVKPESAATGELRSSRYPRPHPFARR